jgi:hypothetical protein
VTTDFPSDGNRRGRQRNPDYSTSAEGARHVGRRAPNQRMQLLLQYREAAEQGLTDEEAARAAGLFERTCYWKRCGELRQDGYVERISGYGVRMGSAGTNRIVCAITDVGLRKLTSLGL